MSISSHFFFLDPSCVTSLWTVHLLSQGRNEDIIVVSTGWWMHPGTFRDSFLVFMICHLEVATWLLGTLSGIVSGSAPRKVSGMDAGGVLPETDVCFRRGCGQRTDRQLCNNCRRCAGRMSYAIVIEGFLFFSFLFLKPWDSRCLRIPSSGCSLVACSPLQIFAGRCNEGAEGCFEFYILY